VQNVDKHKYMKPQHLILKVYKTFCLYAESKTIWLTL